MNKLTNFKIPENFISARALLTPGELAFGYCDGWVTLPEAVQLATRGYGKFEDAPEEYEDLALVLTDDMGSAERLIYALCERTTKESENKKVWIFLTLEWVYENRYYYSDPLNVVELLYTDFGHPDEIEHLVRFMPTDVAEEKGEGQLCIKWKKYLATRSNFFWWRFGQH